MKDVCRKCSTFRGFGFAGLILGIVVLVKEIIYVGENNSRSDAVSHISSHLLHVQTTTEIEHVDFTRGIMNGDGPHQQYTESLSLPCCDIDMKTLKGREQITMMSQSFQSLGAMFPDSHVGGRFKPIGCRPRGRIAIILPFRDRESHLKIYLRNVIPKLKRQKLDFTIYVIEQTPGTHFNRGMMRNVGFVEASKIADYDCFIFNDVDSIFEDDRNIFRCGTDKIRHLVTGVDVFKYRLKYSILVGGIIAFTPNQFRKINGYSNFYFDWGAEDDDVYYRIERAKMKIERPDTNSTVGFMSTLKHDRDPEVKYRFDILYSRNNATTYKDGINSLKYKVKMIEPRKLYTWVYVSVDENEVLQGLDEKLRRKIKAYRAKTKKS